MFRRRRNVSRWKPYQTAITAHLELQDIECSAAGGMYRDGNHINPLSKRISILFGSCLTKSLDDLLQTRISTTPCKSKQPESKNSCKDIECSAAGGMYRDGCYIKPRSQRISGCKDIECSAAGGMYRDGYCILEIMQMFEIETLRVSRGTRE